MADPFSNFGISFVATAPSPATSGLSLAVDAGTGLRFPAPGSEGAFNAVVCPAGAAADLSNAEIIRVSARSTDTFGTIARAQEGTTARSIQVGDQIYMGVTKKAMTDRRIETADFWTAKGQIAAASASAAAGALSAGTDLRDRMIADSAASLGLRWVPHMIRKPADGSAIVSNTTPANDADLLWPIAANEVWFFQTWLLINAANATMDYKIGWSVPAGCTMIWGCHSVPAVTQGGYGPAKVGDTVLGMSSESSQLGFGTFAGTTGCGLAGVVTNGATAGNVNLKISQNTSDGGNLVVKANSMILVWRLA